MLTVRDLATMPGLELSVAAGADGLANEVSWLHVSELADPTEFLEGGEFLLTTGLGVGEEATTQRAYVRRLAEHGLSGLGFGIGFGFPAVPAPLVEEADKLSFPTIAVPYELPFVAITKAAFSHLAGEQLEQLTRALAVHERLADAVIQGRGLQALLAVVCNHLDCSLALVDESGRVVSERHGRRRISFEDALELPVVAGGEVATLRAAREGGRSRSTTSSSSTTARPRWPSSSPAGAPSARPSCASRATCWRTSKASGSTTARRAGAWRPSDSSRPRATQPSSPRRGTGRAASRCAARSPRSSTGGTCATSRRRGATARRSSSRRPARRRSSGSPRRS